MIIPNEYWGVEGKEIEGGTIIRKRENLGKGQLEEVQKGKK